MSKKLWLSLLVILVLLSIVLVVSGRGKRTPQETKIGAILPLSGDAAPYGKSAQKAIDLAVEKANANAAANGAKIKIVYEDSQALPTAGVSAARKLIDVDKVPAIIGDLVSSVTLACAPVCEKAQVVLLSPASSSPKITEAGDFIFRNAPSDTAEGGIMADYAYTKLGLRRIDILYINNEYGTGIKDIFQKSFTQHGGTTPSIQSFEQGSTDVRNQLTKIQPDQPDAVYLVGYKEMGTILKQAFEMGIKTQFLSTVMFEDPDILKVAGQAAEGVIYTASAFDTKSEDKTIKQFVDDFWVKYGSDPDIFAALTYDSANIMISALKQGNAKGATIRDALYSFKGFRGVMGELSFDKNGDVIIQPVIKNVKSGLFTKVADN